MYKLILMLLIFINQSALIASSVKCDANIARYKVVKGSIYPFTVDKKEACFFAFYTTNPEPMIGSRGNGNLGDSLWYGYYMKSNPKKIYEFPKPPDNFWSNVCSIEAVSFYPMHGGTKRDVTVIGSCNNQNAVHYTFPFVFVRQGDKFVLDEKVFWDLYGFLSLTVPDVKEYIKSPKKNYKILRDRYNAD